MDPNRLELHSTLTEIAGELRSARRILAMCHLSPDGDAIGALLGLGWLIEALPGQRKIVLACQDPVPEPLQFLPGADRIVTDPPIGPWDVVVSLDASDAARLGDVFRPASYGDAKLLNVDHHVTNLAFGDLNYVDQTAAATAQVLVDLADVLGVRIGPEAAECLLTGIVTDTLAFRTSNTDARVLSVALRLMEAGANLTDITNRTLNSRPFGVLRLWGLALGRMQLIDQVVWSEVSAEMRRAAGLSDDEDGGLVSQLISASEARVAALFSEAEDGKVDINLRSRPGYDVAQVALRLGGGGHPQAAGCKLGGTLLEVEARVLPLLVAVVSGSAI